MFKIRLSNLFDFTSRSFRESVKRMDRSTPASQKLCEAIGDHIDGIIAFAIQFSVKTTWGHRKQKMCSKAFAYRLLC
jgi:hypothetical protein